MDKPKMPIIKNTITPEEHAAKLVRKHWKTILEPLNDKDKDKIFNDITKTVYSAIDAERENTDKFISITENEGGIVAYYLYLMDKVKSMATEALVQDSKKKRDLLLIEMSRILGANIVEERLPVKCTIREKI